MNAPVPSPLSSAAVVAFVPTRDFAPAHAFYATTLGLTLLAQDEFALLFALGATQLRVVKILDFKPAPFTILGWRVADVAATVATLAARGVVFERFPGMTQDARGVWTAPSGARIAWFKDPDGNILSISEQS